MSRILQELNKIGEILLLQELNSVYVTGIEGHYTKGIYVTALHLYVQWNTALINKIFSKYQGKLCF